MSSLIPAILFAVFSMFSLAAQAQEAGSSFNERKIVSRKISGQIFCTDKGKKAPLSGAKVALIDYDKTVASAKSGKDGTYFLDVKVKEGERYDVKVTSPCGDANRDLLIQEEQESNTMNFNFAKE